MRYKVKIVSRADGVHTVEINASAVRYYDDLAAAKAFVDGLFYDGYARDDLVDTREELDRNS